MYLPTLPGCGISGLWAPKGRWGVQLHQNSLSRTPWDGSLIVFSQVPQINLFFFSFISLWTDTPPSPPGTSFPDQSLLAWFWTGYSHPLCFWHLCLASDETFVLGEMRGSKRHIRSFLLIKCWTLGFLMFPLDYMNSVNESPTFLGTEGFWPLDPCLFHGIIGYETHRNALEILIL